MDIPLKLYLSMWNRNYSRDKDYDFIPFFLFPALGLSLFFSFAPENTMAVLYWRATSFFLLIVYTLYTGRFYLIQLVTFRTQKNLGKRCSFKLVGWEKFCKNSVVHNHLLWFHNVRITLQFTSNPNPETVARISKACQLICKNCNDVQFEYEGNLCEWEFEENKLYGSANSAVIGVLYRFILNELTKIDQNNTTISSLEFVFSNQIDKNKKAYRFAD